jgi:hypothetical protein
MDKITPMELHAEENIMNGGRRHRRRYGGGNNIMDTAMDTSKQALNSLNQITKAAATIATPASVKVGGKRYRFMSRRKHKTARKSRKHHRRTRRRR